MILEMNYQLQLPESATISATKIRYLAENTGDPIIKAAIAQNPNTPPEILLELAGDYLAEIGENPAIDLILLENPDFIEKIYDKHFVMIFKNGKKFKIIGYERLLLPAWFVKLCLDSANSSLRELIASNRNSKRCDLEKLAKDPDLKVKIAVAANINTPLEILISWINDPQSEPKLKGTAEWNLSFSVREIERAILKAMRGEILITDYRSI